MDEDFALGEQRLDLAVNRVPNRTPHLGNGPLMFFRFHVY
jgi:hypothetical protein